MAFSAVNLSVIKHYFSDKGERGGVGLFNNLVLPLIGFVLTIVTVAEPRRPGIDIGLIWLAIGFVWLLGVTRGFQRPTPVLDLKE